MRLASIQTVSALEPIPGADRIETAKVLGYQTIVRKGDFKVGDLCIWHEPDTVLPETARYEFMRPRGFRLRTMRMRGVFSHGLALPLDGVSGKVGDDVTDVLGITKYEKPEPTTMSGEILGSFPGFISKTDEPNLRSYPDALGELHGKQIVVTVKIDGCSATYFNCNGTFGVCSRNCMLKEDDRNVFWKIAKKYDLKDKLPEGYAIQGEVYGPGIQGNRTGASEHALAVFDVFYIHHQQYLGYACAHTFCVNRSIPTVYELLLGPCNYSIDDFVRMANTAKYPNGSPAEGIVIRPAEPCVSLKLPRPRLSVKVLSEVYGAKHGE